MSHRRVRLGIAMTVVPVLLRLPRLFVSSEVLRLPLLLGNTMGVRRSILQFGSPLMVFVVRSVVIAG